MVTKMEKSLFEKLKTGMQSFNTAQMLDIPTGKLLNGGQVLDGPVGLPARDMGPSIWIMDKMQFILEQYAPNTHERWISAVNLLRYMRYTVKWEDQTKCPEVFWINTEGNADNEARMIHDILHRDYLKEKLERSNAPEIAESGVIFAFMDESMANAGHEVILIDSISQDSTVVS